MKPNRPSLHLKMAVKEQRNGTACTGLQLDASIGRLCSRCLLLVACAIALWPAAAIISHDTDQAVISSYMQARDQVDAMWNSTSAYELPCAEATIFGHIKKQATMSQSATIRMAKHAPAEYAQARVPIYAGCQILVSDKYRFIFIRTPKSASSAILKSIRQTFCARTLCTRYELRNHLWNATPLPDLMWEQYFVFTFIRNPWTRMQSAHRFLTSRYMFQRLDKASARRGAACGASFAKFAVNSNVLREGCERDSCCAYLPEQQRFLPHFVDQHINDQAHCIFLSDGASLVDFVGRSDNAAEDWREIVRQVSQQSGRTVRQETIVEQVNTSNKSQRKCKREQGLEPPEHGDSHAFYEADVRGIAIQYARDVTLYGYM